MRALTLAGIAAGLLALAGCKTLPPYAPPAGTPTAPIQLWGGYSPRVCIDEVTYRLPIDDKGQAMLATGQRLTLVVDHSFGDGNVTWSCHPRISFVPQAGVEYRMQLEVESEVQRCTNFVYRVSTANRVGLALEPTMDRGRSCAN